MSRSAAVLLAAGIIFPITSQGASLAQTEPATPVPPAAATGSADVLIDGKPAQRAGDPSGAAEAPQGSPDVLINGKPAMTGGGCPPGSVPITSPNVFINGKPAVTGCSK
jgi:uncharacterized Zn-binding protein involved in type VI secretion